MSNKQAKPAPITLYLIHLNPESKGSRDRFAVMYRNADETLSPLWGDYMKADPADDRAWNAAGRKGAKAWPYMVYSPRPASGPDKWPAFHFSVDGYGFSKPYALAEALAHKLRYPVRLIPVNGWASTGTTAEPPKDLKRASRKAALAALGARFA